MAALIGDRVGSWEEANKYFPKIFPFQTFYISEGQLQPPELDNSLLSPTQKGQPMKPINATINSRSARLCIPVLVLTLASMLWAPSLFAQAASPWENAVNLLETSFTGPLARGLSLIAIVIGGLMFTFSGGGSKKVFAGIVFDPAICQRARSARPATRWDTRSLCTMVRRFFESKRTGRYKSRSSRS